MEALPALEVPVQLLGLEALVVEVLVQLPVLWVALVVAVALARTLILRVLKPLCVQVDILFVVLNVVHKFTRSDGGQVTTREGQMCAAAWGGAIVKFGMAPAAADRSTGIVL